MVYHLIESVFDEKTGKSYITICYKNKFYTGFARLHPDDADKASKFAGCRFAEERACIKALKAELKEKKHNCEECRKFVKVITSYAHFDPKSYEARMMFRQLNRRIKEVNNLIDEINERESNLQASIRRQGLITNALQRKINKDKED